MKANAPKWIVAILWIIAVMDLVTRMQMSFFPGAWFFRLVPGVTETGPFTGHLVMDGGTFFLAVGIGLVAAALNPRRNAIAVVVAAVAGIMHSILHLYSHAAGLLSSHHMIVEVLGIYVPAVVLIVIAVNLYRLVDETRPAAARAA